MRDRSRRFKELVSRFRPEQPLMTGREDFGCATCEPALAWHEVGRVADYYYLYY